jgi:zinc transport system substrate-binding protein
MLRTDATTPAPRRLRRIAFVFACLGCVVAATGCGASGPASRADAGAGRVAVTAGFYPLEEAARAIGGSRVTVNDLTPVGGQPHGLELRPRQLAALERSDLVLYLGDGFQPQVEKAVASLPSSVRRVDLLRGVGLRPAQAGIPGLRGQVDGGAGGPEALNGDRDPHVWVDPARFMAMATRIRDALIAADPPGRAAYDANATRYLATLRALDRDFRARLRGCHSPVLVTSHAAFGYLADRYHLLQAAIAGISPEAEPDPRSLVATARYAKAHGVRTVFFETLVPRKLSQTVARTIGARTDALNPVEGLTAGELKAGETYTSIQRRNLDALVRGLGCTGS